MTVTGSDDPKSSTLFISVSSTTNDDCIIDADIVGVPSGVPERLKRKIAPFKMELAVGRICYDNKVSICWATEVAVEQGPL